MASSLCPNNCAWAQILPPKYEEDTITQYWVMAHFSYIHYVSVWPWPWTYFPQNWVTWLGVRDEHMCLFRSLYTFSFLIYEAIKYRFSDPVASQPALPWQPFCAALVWVVLISMTLMWSPIKELWHILCVSIICPCDLDLWPIYTKIGSWLGPHVRYVPILTLVEHGMFNMFYRNADFVAPLLGNWCRHGNRFEPHSLESRPDVTPRVWSW